VSLLWLISTSFSTGGGVVVLVVVVVVAVVVVAVVVAVVVVVMVVDVNKLVVVVVVSGLIKAITLLATRNSFSELRFVVIVIRTSPLTSLPSAPATSLASPPFFSSVLCFCFALAAMPDFSCSNMRNSCNSSRSRFVCW